MDMTALEAAAHRYQAANEALENARAEMQTTAVAVLQGGAKQADVARITGWSREYLRRLRDKAANEAREAELERLRKQVEELTNPGPPSTRTRPAAATPRVQATATMPEPPAPPRESSSKPKPSSKGRPLSELEARNCADLARSRADTLQLRRLEQDAAMAGDAYKDCTVVSSALDMRLLTHDEVYGAAEPPQG
jgi:hypothetical protein